MATETTKPKTRATRPPRKPITYKVIYTFVPPPDPQVVHDQVVAWLGEVLLDHRVATKAAGARKIS